MFGPHLMMDCSSCDQDKLASVDLISKVLDEFPDAVGMTKIMPPYVFRYHGEVPEDWGVSGVVLIAESHISIHTWPYSGYAAVDVFMCGDADPDKCVPVLQEAFAAKRIEVSEVRRGEEAAAAGLS